MNENELDLKNLFPPNWKEEFNKSLKEAIEYVNSHPNEDMGVSNEDPEIWMKNAIKNGHVVYGTPELFKKLNDLREKMIENGEL